MVTDPDRGAVGSVGRRVYREVALLAYPVVFTLELDQSICSSAADQAGDRTQPRGWCNPVGGDGCDLSQL